MSIEYIENEILQNLLSNVFDAGFITGRSITPLMTKEEISVQKWRLIAETVRESKEEIVLTHNLQRTMVNG